MAISYLDRIKGITGGLLVGFFGVILGLVAAAPAHAASTVQLDWVDATNVKFGGSAVTGPIAVTGNFVANVVGAPTGTQTFVASSNGPVLMSFGCSASMTLNIFADTSGVIDYSKGNLVFTTSAPSTCSQATLKNNIAGLVQDPQTGAATLSLNAIAIGSVNNRGPAGGTDDPKAQIVNVTAGMGQASDYSNLPPKDMFVLCAAQGSYANNIDSLMSDCIAHKPSALYGVPVTSSNITSLQDGKGPGGGNEQAWTGSFTNVKAGLYVACSDNFKACVLFVKNPGIPAPVYITFGATAGSVIPGQAPGKGATDKVCTTGTGLAGAAAWILCPLVQLMAEASNFFENSIIVPFMTVSPLTTNAQNPTYILWQDIRNVANVGFILFFFFVIFSQATSIGISNYGIKRILPKMGLVVIGVNLSYFIVAIIIDAFNIFGAGISALVVAALTQAQTQQQNFGTTASAASIWTLGTVGLLAIISVGGAVIGWLFSVIGLAFVVIVVVVFILVIRQMAIIVLVILSPIAILMYMLPNTENYFNKWRKTLMQLLIMYPIIVLLFAAGKIFGILLQPGSLTLTGLTGQAEQAARIILQFFAYVIPLAGVPFVFAASGSLMNRAYGLARGRVIQPRTSQVKEGTARLGKEGQMRLATNKFANRIGVGQAAGFGLRRKAVRETRERNLQHTQQEYIAEAMANSTTPLIGMQARAAGVAGQAGRTRAAAGAANVAAKGRAEDIDSEMSLLDAKMRELGTNQKTFAGAIGKYLEDPTNTANQTFTGSNGHTFNFATEGGQFQRALLNSAASQGEVKAIEAARLRYTDERDQLTLDDIIRRNDGKLKEKGGYHLATQFDLAATRMTKPRTNANGDMLDAAGQITRDPAQAARVPVTDPVEAKTIMARQRMAAIADSGANSIAGMKAGLLGDTEAMITRIQGGAPPANAPQAEKDNYTIAANAFNSLSDTARQKMFDRLDEIVNNPNTLARSEGSDSLRNMRETMRTQMGYTHSSTHPTP